MSRKLSESIRRNVSFECDVKGALQAGLLPVWYIGAIDRPYTEDTNIPTAKTWRDAERFFE